jgi:hypothetical protein
VGSRRYCWVGMKLKKKLDSLTPLIESPWVSSGKNWFWCLLGVERGLERKKRWEEGKSSRSLSPKIF